MKKKNLFNTAYYDEEEKELIDFVEDNIDDFQSIPNLESEKKRYAKIFKEANKKTERMNIRMTERDMYMLKLEAKKEGIPYQTLVTSILHKYVNGTLKHV